MSWSMHVEGTVEGCKRQLSEHKIHGTPAPEEQALFDWAREALLKALDAGYRSTDERALVIFKCSAAGHAAQLSSLGFTYSIAWQG